MSNIAFRDSSIIIIETGRTQIRAGLGIHDLLKTSTFDIPARVGLRRSSITNGNGYSEFGSLNGRDNGATPRAGPSSIEVNNYLVGAQLDEALAAGEDLLISWPFADGNICDYTQAEALWKYVLFKLLGLKRTQNESPAMLCFAHGLPRDAQERVCQIFFERFNIAGFTILDRPLAQLYASNSLSGLTVDVGLYSTDICPVYDCFVQHNCCMSTPIGLRDCELYLVHLLKSKQELIKTLSPEDTPLSPEQLHDTLIELVRHLYKEGHIRAPNSNDVLQDVEDEGLTNIAAVLVAGKEKSIIETGMKKKATAKASAAEQARAKEIEALDLIQVDFLEKTLTIGRERHRFCEPLFDPSVLKGVQGLAPKPENIPLEQIFSVQDACGFAMLKVDIYMRIMIWSSLLVTGEINAVKGIGATVQTYLSTYLVSNAEVQSETQPRYIRVLHIPEYFAEYRDKGDGHAAFLGSSIVAKVIFGDPNGRSFVSKNDYNTLGPRAILEMTPNSM